jgi:hypothetical protein
MNLSGAVRLLMVRRGLPFAFEVLDLEFFAVVASPIVAQLSR